MTRMNLIITTLKDKQTTKLNYYGNGPKNERSNI